MGRLTDYQVQRPLAGAIPRRIVFFFIDGVGVGSDDPASNPIARARLPNLRTLLGERVPVQGQIAGPVAGPGRMRAVDANLGVAGRPQSGTGQTALLTGRNAPELLGRHFGPWVHTGLREVLARENLFARALELGSSVSFANAYPRGHFEGRFGRFRPGAFPLAARAAGVLQRDEASLRDGDALVSSIETGRWKRYVDSDAPAPAPEEAGRTLARISEGADLTVFAHYDTDLAGHRRDLSAGSAAILLVDAFLGGLLPALPPETLLLISSDHGNLEDIRTGHTRNPVPLIAVGPGSEWLIDRVASLTDFAPSLLELVAGVVAERGRSGRTS